MVEVPKQAEVRTQQALNQYVLSYVAARRDYERFTAKAQDTTLDADIQALIKEKATEAYAKVSRLEIRITVWLTDALKEGLKHQQGKAGELPKALQTAIATIADYLPSAPQTAQQTNVAEEK